MRPLRDITDHPRDVLSFVADELMRGANCILAVVVATEGSSARAVGSLMGISDSGLYAGYISNGCVDSDLAGHALEALKDKRSRRVRYGANSPFIDIRLPCGGAVEVLLSPCPDVAELTEAVSELDKRRQVKLVIDGDEFIHLKSAEESAKNPSELSQTEFLYAPSLQIVIAGRGEETISLARLARAARYKTIVFSPDGEVGSAVEGVGAEYNALLTVTQTPSLPNDPWTAVVLLFHDHEWEADFLVAALKTRAFYIGAMGSRKTQASRLETLKGRGVDETLLQRVVGPIGLIPAAKDSAKLAVSILAEIVDRYKPVPPVLT